jgi:hypothetical protein
MTSWRIALSASALALAAGCGGSSPSSQPPPAAAPIVLDQPHQDYQAIKSVIAQLAEAEVREREAELNTPDRVAFRAERKAELEALKASDPEAWKRETAMDAEMSGVDLYHCTSASDAFISNWAEASDLTVRMANLAYDVWLWNRDLQPYPKSVWEPRLAAFESSEIDRIIRDPKSDDSADLRAHGFSQTLAAEVNDAIRGQSPALTPIRVDGGCGAGEFGVRIVTEPKGAQVLFIPNFFYELCRAQHTDPEDTTKCKRWREAIDGTVQQVSGDYYYFAKWPDGVTRRGKLTFTHNEEGPFDESCQCTRPLITLAKPK